MATLKATAFLAYCEYIKTYKGNTALETIKTSIDSSDKAILFEQPLLDLTRIDYHALHRFVMAADKICGNGNGKFAIEMAEYQAQKNLTGMYRFFISMTSPRFVLKNGPRLWSLYFGEGDCETKWLDGNHAQFIVKNFKHMPIKHELTHNAFIAEAIKLAGAKNIKHQHLKCLAKNDDCCVFDFIWD